MSTKGNAVNLTALIQAERSAKAPEHEAWQDGTTWVQYLAKGREQDGKTKVVFTPTRKWTSLERGDAVLCNKQLAGVIAAQAQWEAAHQQGSFAYLGTAPEALETPEAVLGFGRDDRIFEVELTDKIMDLLAARSSFDGEEHVEFFKGKAKQRNLERAAYRMLRDPKVAAAVAALIENND